MQNVSDVVFLKGLLKWWLSFFCAMLVFQNGNAQDDYVFEHIGTKEGLSQSDVNCIYQDKLGYIWFGTHDGLNRFDGYSFAVFRLIKRKTPKVAT